MSQAEGNKPVGIYVTKGMRISIPEGGLQISVDENGKTSGHLSFEVLIDVTQHWLSIAYEHVLETEVHSKNVMLHHEANDPILKAEAMESEFRSAMQACTSAAIAIDAFYATVKNYISIPTNLTKVWRDKRTARYKQIAETFRVGFNIKPEPSKNLRHILKQVNEWRDLAVHPSGSFTKPMYHPDLKVATEWRFVYYRFFNAKNLYRGCLSVISALCGVEISKNKHLEKYLVDIKPKIEELVQKYEEKYGSMHENV